MLLYSVIKSYIYFIYSTFTDPLLSSPGVVQSALKPRGLTIADPFIPQIFRATECSLFAPRSVYNTILEQTWWEDQQKKALLSQSCWHRELMWRLITKQCFPVHSQPSVSPYYCSRPTFVAVHYWCCQSYPEDPVNMSFHYSLSQTYLNILYALILITSQTNELDGAYFTSGRR